MKLHMSLFEYHDQHDALAHQFRSGHNVLYILAGRINIAQKTYRAGQTTYVKGTDHLKITLHDHAKLLHFAIQKQSEHVPHPSAILQHSFDMAQSPILLRLDQVSFPVGARAFRHIHHGAGIRYLKDGTLKIISDHGQQIIEQGQAWFEDVASPVEAIPQHDLFASFIRAMIIPAQYEGRTTIEYLNEVDKERPKLQTTERFLDQAISF